MNLKDIAVSPLTLQLLTENGRIDARENPTATDWYPFWVKLADELGFSNGRTPAQEAYLDGWYDPKARG